MKKHYKKYYNWRAEHPGDWHFQIETGGYFRSIRTFCEIRRNVGDYTDLRDEKIRYRDRTGNKMLDAWNDYPISKGCGRSWKTFTKHRKQWMVRRDPEPLIPSWWYKYGPWVWDRPWKGSFR